MIGSGKHVLGYVVVGSTGLLLIAEKVRTACTLPGNHEVKSVSVSRWHRMPLQVGRNASTCQLLILQSLQPQGQLHFNTVACFAYTTPVWLAQENEASGSNSPVREEQARGIDKLTTFPIDGGCCSPLVTACLLCAAAHASLCCTLMC